MHREPTVSLDDYRILVTGGTTGIGRATALELAAKGAKVLITGTDPSHLEDALDSFARAPGEITGVLADLGTKEGVLEVFAAVDQQLGGLDIAILNAGIAESGPLLEMSHDICHEIVNVNLGGYISCALESLKRMSGEGGQIILIGSMSAEECGKNAATYVASKSGVRGFAKSLRKEANPLGIRVSLIEPGKTGSDMQDSPPSEQEEAQEEMKMLTAEDVARSVMFVLSQPDRCDIVMLQLRPRLEEI
ncbi:SDR family oxidoreductase [Luteolibacter flavescens]|uniref:SDR family oxidoreductase n=1 Tax=Luteolibacter flavescens TaxID=1859460 RepID=A0ABT3FNA9_9BACT|nr:SDR family oxidoreductase [Luteolibacter flavescens]MCW1885050.1 SDR family oxidoreductase [Luteolibacter flavescens]